MQLDFSFYLHNLVIENKFDFTKNKLINQISLLGVESEEQRAKSKEQRVQFKHWWFRIQDTRYKIQDTRYKIQDTGYKIQDTRYMIRLLVKSIIFTH